MITDDKGRIDVRFFLLFIPVAYCSYLFHEFGHWSVGEFLGNRMSYSLDYVWPTDGHYVREGRKSRGNITLVSRKISDDHGKRYYSRIPAVLVRGSLRAFRVQ